MSQAVGKINPYAPSESVRNAFLGWEQMLEVYTPAFSMFGIGAPVDSMAYEGATAEEQIYTAEVGVGGWDGVATTALPVTAASANTLTNYAVLKVADEIVIVKSVNRTLNTIDVYARGHGTTAAAAHLAGVVIQITGYNLPLGVKDIEATYTELDTYVNYVSKFTVPALKYTKEDKFIKRKYYGEAGFADYVAQQMLEKDKELLRTMEKSLIRGTAVAGTGSGSTGTPATTRGLIEEAVTRGNIFPNFGALSMENLQDALTAQRNKMGTSNVLLCSTKFYDEIQKLPKTEVQLPQPLNRLSIGLGDKVTVLNTKV